ncbi:MAG: TAT-variant-translocated molybdopterin oxidoreductase [Candidatus Korobacteraceae bacterium]
MEKEPKKTPNPAKDVCPGKRNKLDLETARGKLSEARGPQYWRSLEELANTPEFEEMLHREFPRHASEWTDAPSRRNFLKIMGASLALAGLSACTRQPLEPIVPYVQQPSNLVLGKPLFFATTMPLGAYGYPVLVESHEGRPTKIEGNPQHPATLGGTDPFMQASVLGLYDPDRSQTVTYLGDPTVWGRFVNAMRGPLTAQKALGGAGIRLLTAPTSSPTFTGQIEQVLKVFPQAKRYQWAPVNNDNAMAAAQASFGQPLETQFNFEKAKVVLSLDGDFLSGGFPGFHRNARQFAARRRPALRQEMLRFYMVESTPTNTGGKADHRLPMRASEIESFARGLAAQLGGTGGQQFPLEQRKFAAAVIKELQANRGRSIVVAGENQPPSVHMLAHAMNKALGNVGQTVFYTDWVESHAVNKQDSLRQLVDEMWGGKVDMLFLIGVNPLYDAPADLNFSGAMQKVGLRIHHGLYQDETARLCHWHINATHYLEQWGDCRSFDGTISLIQPLIAPLYGGRSEHELIAALLDQSDANSYEIVQKYWQAQYKGADFAGFWRKSLHDGFVANTASAPKQVSARAGAVPQAQPAAGPAPAAGGLEIMFRYDPSIYDGRFANNGWLQELPKPITQITWDNAVMMSVNTGKKLGIKADDLIELEAGGRKMRGGVWLTPGHPDDSVTVSLGYGRESCGRVGSGVGFNAYKLRASAAPWFATGAKLTKTGQHHGLASTQGRQVMEGRPLARAASLEDFLKNPGFAHEMEEAPAPGLTLYKPYDYSKVNKWGMVIDLNSCIGCNACVVACVAENNIPVVGRLEVKRGRHMHWLRIDNYFEGSPANPRTYYQPVPCQQCENAPCEVVCPVGATVHSTEGLNDMIYNRCVGTRYCSNNCPYKVRRFNFFLYSDYDTAQFKFLHNPDVTVRSRGVMEKCTYCVQRITHGRIRAEEEGRNIRDGEIMPACQQACPADAIIFGDMNDPNSRVAKLKADERNYGLLENLNTRPRTTYLAAVLNTNPDIRTATDANSASVGGPDGSGEGA